jgi:hypothetical protein
MKSDFAPPVSKTKNGGLSMAAFFVTSGLILLSFPKYTGLDGWVAWAFYILGLVVLLVGVLGVCIEVAQ